MQLILTVGPRKSGLTNWVLQIKEHLMGEKNMRKHFSFPPS